MSAEDLERQQMGELTRPIFEERGGFPDNMVQAPAVNYGNQTPPDIDYLNRIRMDSGSAINVPDPLENQTGCIPARYDALPLNAQKFQIVQYEQWELVSGFDNSNLPAILEYTVPAGYSAILRGFRWSFRAATLDEIFDDPDSFFQVGLFIDDSVYANMDDLIGFGIFLNDFIDTYIPVEPQKKISLKIQPVNNFDVDEGPFTVKMAIKGDLLLNTGLPANLQPGFGSGCT